MAGGGPADGGIAHDFNNMLAVVVEASISPPPLEWAEARSHDHLTTRWKAPRARRPHPAAAVVRTVRALLPNGSRARLVAGSRTA